MKRLQVGRRYPSSTSLVLNGAKKKQAMTRGGQDLLRSNPFPSSTRQRWGSLSLSFPLFLWARAHAAFVDGSLHFASTLTEISKPKECKLQGENKILIIRPRQGGSSSIVRAHLVSD